MNWFGKDVCSVCGGFGLIPSEPTPEGAIVMTPCPACGIVKTKFDPIKEATKALIETAQEHYDAPEYNTEFAGEPVNPVSTPDPNYDTVGRKDDKGKNKLEILFCHFVRTLDGVGKCCTAGAVKYNEDVDTKNWSKVTPKSRYIGAFFRHIFEWLQGRAIDLETGLPHLHLAIWNLMVLSEFDLGLEKIDE